MDIRKRKRLQEIRNMTNDQLEQYRKNLVERGFAEGLRAASNALVQGMEEEPRISGPMIERVKERAVGLINTLPVDMGDKSDD